MALIALLLAASLSADPARLVLGKDAGSNLILLAPAGETVWPRLPKGIRVAVPWLAFAGLAAAARLVGGSESCCRRPAGSRW